MGRNILCWRRIQAFVKNSPDAASQTAALVLLEREGDFAEETRKKDDVWRRRSELFRDA
jgi:hypothetical protein